MDVAADEGADAAIRLLHRLAEEFGVMRASAVLADIAAGLQLRRDTDEDD